MNPLLPKGLVLITGKMGSGKSLTMAMQALEAIRTGWEVHADFTIHPLEEQRNDYRFNCLDEFNKIYNSLILVDEAQSIGLNARRAMSKENISTMDIITNSRKRGNTIILGSQIVIMVDTLCRQLADYMIVPYIEEVQGTPILITWVIKEQRGFGDARKWCTVDIIEDVFIPQYVLDSYSTHEIIDWDRTKGGREPKTLLKHQRLITDCSNTLKSNHPSWDFTECNEHQAYDIPKDIIGCNHGAATAFFDVLGVKKEKNGYLRLETGNKYKKWDEIYNFSVERNIPYKIAWKIGANDFEGFKKGWYFFPLTPSLVEEMVLHPFVPVKNLQNEANCVDCETLRLEQSSSFAHKIDTIGEADE